jgi:hypothetical protein
MLDDPGFQALAAARARPARERLVGYLRRQRFLDGGKVAVVDVGWHGTIQDNLTRAVRGEPGAPEVRGSYFGLYGEGESLDRKEGAVYDQRRAVSMTEMAPLHFVQLFEEAARTDEGMTLDYQSRGENFEAIIKNSGPDYEAERAAMPAIRALQAGVFEYVRHYAADAAAGRAPSLAELRGVAQRRLERLIFFPSAEEVHALSALAHADDWAEVRWGSVVAGASPAALLTPGRWIDRFYQSYWKPAYLQRTGGAIACRLFHLYESARLLRKSRARKPARHSDER